MTAGFRSLARPCSRAARTLSRRPALTGIALAVLAIALAMSWAGLFGVRLPSVHDEHAYLLGAETFASGRLTNPSPEVPLAFETPHVLVRPTYASKYPPAQSLVLAAGEIVFGHPIAGVWMGFAAAVLALLWALRAVTPFRWALLGSLAYVLTFAAHPWSQTYWGGHVAAAGGALVLGGALRASRSARPATLTLLALGLVVLASSRPYEGFVFSVPLSVLAFVGTLRLARSAGARRAIVAAAPAVLLLAAATAGTLRLNAAVTGDPLRMPYVEHTAQYQTQPLFVFQEHRARSLENSRTAQHYGGRTPKAVDAAGLLGTAVRITLRQIGQLTALPLAIGLLALPWVLLVRRRRGARAAFLSWALTVLAMTVASHNRWSHYAAPATVAVYVLCVEGLRRLRVMPRQARRLPFRRLPLVALMGIPLAVRLALAGPELHDLASGAESRKGGRAAAARRAGIEERLRARGGRHLVLVRYEGYSRHVEWVHNGADLSEVPVLWAHDLGVAGNEELVEHHPAREVWLLVARDSGEELRRYEED